VLHVAPPPPPPPASCCFTALHNRLSSGKRCHASLRRQLIGDSAAARGLQEWIRASSSRTPRANLARLITHKRLSNRRWRCWWRRSWIMAGCQGPVLLPWLGGSLAPGCCLFVCGRWRCWHMWSRRSGVVALFILCPCLNYVSSCAPGGNAGGGGAGERERRRRAVHAQAAVECCRPQHLRLRHVRQTPPKTLMLPRKHILPTPPTHAIAG